MKNRFSLHNKIIFIIVFLIVFFVVIPVRADLLDQSLYSTGFRSDVDNEINASDVTTLMKDGLLEQGIRVQKSHGKYDILSFRLNRDATQLASLFLGIYVNNIDSGGHTPSDGWGTQTAHMYAYHADGYSAQSSMVLEFNVTYGWNDLDVTPLLSLLDGFGFVKFRIVAVRNWFEVSEARFTEINHSPVAVPNGPYSGVANSPIVFSSDGSYDPDGDTITYLWDFGDGNISTETNPTHTYDSADKYSVTLTVTDTNGNSDTATTTATINTETIETIRPTDVYNPDGWINPSYGFDGDISTYTYKITPNKTPSLSFGGSSLNEAINAWQSKSHYWYAAWLYIILEGWVAGRADDLAEVVVTDQNGNLKQTILIPSVGVSKRGFPQKLNMSDWGDGFSNIGNIRVRVNSNRQGGADGAEWRVYDVRIDGNTSTPVKNYTRGVYSLLPRDESNLTTAYTLDEEFDVMNDDNNRVSQSGSANQYMVHLYKRKILSQNITIRWDGQISNSGVEAYAQSFKPNTSGNITEVRIFLKNISLPNGYLRVRIKSELGGEVIAESNAMAESSLDYSGSWKTFTFAHPPSVIAGNTYYMEIWRDKGDENNYPEVTVRDCPDFEGSTWYRSEGNWLSGVYKAILFEGYINGVLDLNTSCSVPITPDRGIDGLDWGSIYLETYNRTSSSWIQLDTKLYDGSTSDIDLSGTVSSQDYIDSNGWIAARVYATNHNDGSVLATDFIDFSEAGGEILVNPSTIDFGSFEVGMSKSLSLTISNIGTGNLSIGTFTLPSSPFSVTSDECSGKALSVSSTCSVTVEFAPITIGAFKDSLKIPSNDITHPSMTVNLTGTAILSPAHLTGIVTNASTGVPLSNVTVTVTDSLGTHSTTTDFAGMYTVSGLVQGSFTARFEKSGYSAQTVNGTVNAGQTLTLNIQLTSIPPLTIAITNPQDGATVYLSPIIVTGTASNNANVVVNGVQASVSNNTFSASIFLSEGQNTITATANDMYGQTVSHSITVTFLVQKPPAISNIIVSNITHNSATIAWTTDQPSDSLIEYGETIEYGNSKSDSTLTINHTITLTNLKPSTTYHLKITSTNSYGLSSSSGDNTFITLIPQFIATTLGDYGNVTVMEVEGDYDAKKPDGSINFLPRQEIAKEFFSLHQDEYDFLIIFTNFNFAMPDVQAKGFYLEVMNDTEGIGKQTFDNSNLFGSNGILQGTVDMGNILNLATNPFDPNFEQTVNIIGHEIMHRWAAYVKFKDANGNTSTALLGKDSSHWSFLLDTDASLLYGNEWQDNGNGTFTSISANKYYSPLDLYLMGIYDKTEVPQMLLIDNPNIDPARLPEVGVTITGTPHYITIDDIIEAEGERIPGPSESQKTFKIGYILVTAPGTFTGNEISGIENIRNGWAGSFSELTYGEGSIEDVTPSLTITISSPSNNATITRPDVTIRGAIINSTGKETGIIVNGIVATVYGNQFTASHVPLSEGSNTITATATDTAGNTATTSITVNAVTTGNYIRLTSNIESGIPPLEVILRIDGSFNITESTLNITGPVQPELISSSPEEYTVKMTIEGAYTFTVTTTGPDGLTYQDTICVIVMNKTEMDKLLKAKWNGMKTALANQDIQGAAGYFSLAAKDKYSNVFSIIVNHLSAIASDMNEIRIDYVTGDNAEYRISRMENIDGQMKDITYFIYFVKEGDGLWKIESL